MVSRQVAVKVDAESLDFWELERPDYCTVKWTATLMKVASFNCAPLFCCSHT